MNWDMVVPTVLFVVVIVVGVVTYAIVGLGHH